MLGELVATLGPESWDLAAELVQAGATALRLNASHAAPAELGAILARVRAALPAVPVVIDLQGAKMRLGDCAAQTVVVDQALRFTCDPQVPAGVPLPHPELFVQTRVGDTLSVDDGRLRFWVRAAAPGVLDTRALSAGQLRPRKGVNLVEHPIELTDLNASDLAAVEAARGTPGVGWALSFVKDGRELAWLRRRVGPSPVIGKIERQEALDNLAAIAAASDGIWICRGDLGAQIGSVALARCVAGLDPRALGKPVWMAGQVLEHMTACADPTRSEVCHLFDLVARGYAGVILSDETAVGHRPVAAVHQAATLWRAFSAAAEPSAPQPARS